MGAIVPIGMTALIVAAGVVHLAVGGALREPDEGTAAHLFQLLVPAQLPVIGLFAATQLPRDRGWASRVLALQLGSLVALIATVAFLGL